MKKFTLTPDHIKLVRKMWIVWQGDGHSPMVDPKRPYGNSSDVAKDIHLVLTGKDAPETGLNAKQEHAYWKLHSEMDVALQIVLSTGQFKPGKYQCDNYGHQWSPSR